MALNVDYYLRGSWCCPERVQSAPPPSVATPIITSDRMLAWINRANQEIPRVDALNNNGLYSLLEREVTVVTDLLAEGNALVSGINARTPEFIRRGIESLVRPKKEHLEQALTVAQQRVVEHHEEIVDDNKIAEKWANLGLPASILERHADCARFMMESGLAFSIVGYRETTHNPALHDIRLAPDGHPLIKVQGHWIRWERLKAQVVYDPLTYMIRSRDYPGQIAQAWTYLSEQGLVPIDRMNNERLVPIHRLNPIEYQSVLNQARRFYETNDEVDVGTPKDCVVQFMTSPSRRLCSTLDIEEAPLLENFAENINAHIVMRLILPNGDVYSFGLEMPAESQEFLFNNGTLTRFMATVPAKVNKAGDYEEFRSFHERHVTGIPLTSHRANHILQMLNQMEDVPFQFFRQNCSNLMRVVMRESGYTPVDNRTTLAESLWSALPNGDQLPYIGPVIGAIQSVTNPIFNFFNNWTPDCIKTGLFYLKAIVMYIPGKIGNFGLNLLILYLGGREKLYPLKEGVQEDEFYDTHRFVNFSSLIRSFWDMFSDETTVLYHSKHFIQWQKQQRSTFTREYTGRPELVIVPSPAA